MCFESKTYIIYGDWKYASTNCKWIIKVTQIWLNTNKEDKIQISRDGLVQMSCIKINTLSS